MGSGETRNRVFLCADAGRRAGSQCEDRTNEGLRSREELNRENEVLWDRVTGLGAARVRISAETLLSQLVESARQGPVRKRLTTWS